MKLSCNIRIRGSAIWSEFFLSKILSKIPHLKCFFLTWSKFSCNLKRNTLSQAMFSSDIKQIFSSDLQWNPLSAAKSSIYSKIHYLRLIYQSKAIFLSQYEVNVIWSEIRYLKRIFRYEEIFSSDIKKSCDIKRNPQSETNFFMQIFHAIWSEIRYLKWFIFAL